MASSIVKWHVSRCALFENRIFSIEPECRTSWQTYFRHCCLPVRLSVSGSGRLRVRSRRISVTCPAVLSRSRQTWRLSPREGCSSVCLTRWRQRNHLFEMMYSTVKEYCLLPPSEWGTASSYNLETVCVYCSANGENLIQSTWTNAQELMLLSDWSVSWNAFILNVL